MPLQANVEDVLSQDEEEMYQCLMDQTKVKSTWGGQKASLCWWWWDGLVAVLAVSLEMRWVWQ